MKLLACSVDAQPGTVRKMIHLVPFLPMLSDESTMSYVGRVALFHTGRSAFEFLNLAQIDRRDVIEARLVALDRLAELTGLPRQRLEEGSYLKVRSRFFEHRGHQFHSHFTGRSRTTYCPACLLEDCMQHHLGGRRYGRVNWLFTPVRTCPKHEIALVRRKNEADAERYQDMNLVAPEDTLLEDQATRAVSRPVSPLQAYVEARLSGSAGSPWLDGQLIDLGARASQMLGACLRYGAHADLTKLDDGDWDAAGDVGYRYTSRGHAGINDALEQLIRAARNRKGGPQAAFGRLYQWLQFAKNEKDPAPIRDVVRTFIIENMAVDPGTRLFGTVVDMRRRHSVASLAKQAGLHATTLGRAVVGAGLVAAAQRGRVDGFAFFDGAAGEALANLIKSSIPVARIPSYLNCNRTQAEMLVKHGILRRIEPENGPRACVLNYVSIHELDALLKRLRCCGKAVERGGPGMLNMIEASERAKWPTVDILRLVLSGCLSRVELLPRVYGFKSVLVDPDEVKLRLHASEDESLLTIREAAERLALRRTAVRALISRLNGDGRPYLNASTIKSAKGSSRVCVPRTEIERFVTEHVKLGTLAAERGVWDRVLRKQLEDQGILPILPRSVLDAYVYSRADV